MSSSCIYNTANLMVRLTRSRSILSTNIRPQISSQNHQVQNLSASTSSNAQSNKNKELRFDYTGLEMSDRVRKLLDLTNGSKREVVKAQKKQGMQLFQLREGDTGSSAVQVIAITTRIQQMQSHLSTHRKDQSGKRTLQRLYVRRRKLLDYMERKEFDSYRHVVKTLGLVR